MATKGWVSVDENRAARRAILRQIVALKKSRLAPMVVIRGKEGSGKSRLVEDGLARLMEAVPGASYRILEPTDIERSLKAPYSEWYEGHELAKVDWLILENLKPLSENLEVRLSNLLDQRKKLGGLVLVTTRSPWTQLASTTRLASRLRGGICVGLEPWSETSRRKWLGRLMVQGELTLSPSLMRWLARRLPKLPADMETYCQKWVEKQSRKGAPLGLGDFQEPPKQVNNEEVLERVAQAFGVNARQIKGKSREKRLTEARCTAVWLLRKIRGLSLAAIGEILGGRDHSTIRSSYGRAVEKRRQDPHYSQTVKSIQSLI